MSELGVGKGYWCRGVGFLVWGGFIIGLLCVVFLVWGGFCGCFGAWLCSKG